MCPFISIHPYIPLFLMTFNKSCNTVCRFFQFFQGNIPGKKNGFYLPLRFCPQHPDGSDDIFNRQMIPGLFLRLIFLSPSNFSTRRSKGSLLLFLSGITARLLSPKVLFHSRAERIRLPQTSPIIQRRIPATMPRTKPARAYFTTADADAIVPVFPADGFLNVSCSASRRSISAAISAYPFSCSLIQISSCGSEK